MRHNTFYGWVTTGNKRVEVYKVDDSHGGFAWFARTRWHGDALGEGLGDGHRIAAECVAGYDATPEFCFA